MVYQIPQLRLALYISVKSTNGSFMCSVKHCRVLSGGKQLKTRHVCLHVHLLSCCLGLWKAPPPPPLAASATVTVTQSCLAANLTSSSVTTSTLTSFASTSSTATVHSSITSVPTFETSSVSRTSITILIMHFISP